MTVASFVQTHEAVIRLSAIFGIFAAMALWEWRVPRRALTLSRARRWSSHLGLVVLNAVMLRLPCRGAVTGYAINRRSWVEAGGDPAKPLGKRP